MCRRLTVAVVTVVVAAGSLLGAEPAAAAGVTTHGWMAVEAIPHVTDPDLRALLAGHEDQVRAGAMFPDAGYVGTNTFGEEAHWQRFVDAYVALVRQRDCGDLTDPDGPCADLVAHLMGVAAHGMGDEVWDWLFEPNGPDRDEYYTHPAVPLFNEGGAEAQMDVVAVGVHGVPRPEIPPLPDVDLLLQAFDDAGLDGVTAAQFQLAGLGELVWDLESSWVPTHLGPIQSAMPWMSANLRTAPGGVDFAAVAIAGYWSTIWAHLLGAEPTTEVSITHPAPGQDDLPATGWVRSYQPGSSRGRGGAATRIVAVLTDSMPYRPATGGPSVPDQLPAGTMTITDESTGAAVPIMAGYPRIVPYTPDPGEHLVDVQPAADLRPCAWYRVDVGVTTPLLDARGRAVAPHSWSFRTACAADQVVGRVTDPAGAPVAGTWVLPYRPVDGWLPTTWAVTGADGRFDLGVLPPDTYRIAFVPPAGSGLAPTWAGDQPSRSTAVPLVLDGAGAAEATVDAELLAVASLSGRVTDAGGAPVAGAVVRAFGPHDTWVATAAVATAGDGTYRFDGLPAAAYRVAVRPPGPAGPLWWHPGTTSRAAATLHDLASGPQADVDLALP